MAKEQQMARCGVYCEICSHREIIKCPGCFATDGKTFRGPCQIAKCCIEKKYENCSECNDFPCDDLIAYAHDPQLNNQSSVLSSLPLLVVPVSGGHLFQWSIGKRY